MSNLVLSQEDQTFVLSGPTQFGRARALRWAVGKRPVPEEFGNLEVAIQIEDDISVSRNHAAIVPKNGEFCVLDLNSKNGTFVNGKDINPSSKQSELRELGVGDKVRFGKHLEFVVCGEKREGENYGLFVGCSGGDLKGVRNDLDQLYKQFEKRGFSGNIKQLYGGKARRNKVLSELEKVSYLTTPDSHFIFYYSGHGDVKGIGLEDGILSPRELYAKLENLRGKKVVILDCCGAGTFINGKIPPDTLVLAASSKNRQAYERFTRLIGGKRMGAFSSALVKFLSRNPEELNLKDFEDELNSKLGLECSVCYQEPDITGKSFTVLKIG